VVKEFVYLRLRHCPLMDQRARAGGGASQRKVPTGQHHPHLSETKARACTAARASPVGWWLLSALGLMAALALVSAHPARAEAQAQAEAQAGAQAEAEVKVDDGGTVVESDDSGAGMPSSNPRVRPILAAHPGQYVVICVAGCDHKPQAVQVLPRETTVRIGGYAPSMARMGREVQGPPSASQRARQVAAPADDVVCIAGCNRHPGQVVQTLPGLPPSAKPQPKERKSDDKGDNGLVDLLP
jgi:hypothetical protein